MKRTLLLLTWIAVSLPALAAVRTDRPTVGPGDWREKADPWVVRMLESSGEAEFLVVLREEADLSGVERLKTKEEKGRFVVERLRETAERTQAPLRRWLASRGVAHRPFWIANMIWVCGSEAVAAELGNRADVARLSANPQVKGAEPVEKSVSLERAETPATIEWNVLKIHAPDLWAAGFTGQGIVVGGEDTGYEWNHAALINKYRGWNGTTANHNYNWHDAIHSGGGSCGADATAPCDDFGHGTHTMGTMVGDDGGGNQVGVAPGARWIGCRNMDQGVGTPATYTECFQWFIAPTDLAGMNPDPSKAPHVINNSWGCPPSEGCTDPNALKTVVESVRAAGIVVVVSAGNAGSACSTVLDPPAIYQASFSVGATNSSDAIAGFSSRGPVTIDGSGRMKPDVSAPGVSVRSSVPGGGYAVFSGTSMAGPHVAGATALLFSALPALSGQVASLETLLERTAVPKTSAQTCGGVPGSQVPNNTYGWGRIDALAAYTGYFADLAVQLSGGAPSGAPGLPITYTAVVANGTGRATATSVTLAGTLPTGVSVSNVSPTQGSCMVTFPNLSCDLGTLAAGASATVTFDLTPGAPGTISFSLAATEAEPEANTADNSAMVQTPVEFLDVPTSHPFHDFVGRIARFGVTAGCGSGNYCPGLDATRGQMAVFLLRSKDGSSYTPPACVTPVFNDAPCSLSFAPWINELAARGVTAGCGNGNYCPSNPVTRAQMSVFLLRTKDGSSYTPPACTTPTFADVPCSSGFAPWVNEIAARGITAGCGGGNFCPTASVSRGQMAVFLVVTFGLPP